MQWNGDQGIDQEYLFRVCLILFYLSINVEIELHIALQSKAIQLCDYNTPENVVVNILVYHAHLAYYMSSSSFQEGFGRYFDLHELYNDYINFTLER